MHTHIYIQWTLGLRTTFGNNLFHRLRAQLLHKNARLGSSDKSGCVAEKCWKIQQQLANCFHSKGMELHNDDDDVHELWEEHPEIVYWSRRLT